ncbi:MAG: hypothetical protein AAGC55_04605 [Myxococcota bacterium]
MGIGLSKPPQQIVRPAPQVGEHRELPGADASRGPGIVAFLRHPGCPFAEATVKKMRALAARHPEVAFVIVSHGERQVAEDWLSVIGGLGALQWLHSSERDLYGAWGIGYSERTHFINAITLLRVIGYLFRGIRNRADSGTRWQRAATFARDADGTVVWSHHPAAAHELPGLDAALAALGHPRDQPTAPAG